MQLTRGETGIPGYLQFAEHLRMLRIRHGDDKEGINHPEGHHVPLVTLEADRLDVLAYADIFTDTLEVMSSAKI